MRALSSVLSFAALGVLSLGLVTLARADDIEKGKQSFMIYCATCHGEGGDGQGPVGKTLDPAPRDFTKGDFKYGSTDQDIFDVMSDGAASKGGSRLMAPWGAVLPEADRWAVVKFIRSLKSRSERPPESGASSRKK